MIDEFEIVARYFTRPSGDSSIVLGYQDAIKSLTRVANGQQQLCVTQSTPASEQPQMGSNISRGYGGPGGADFPAVGPNNAGFL